MCLLVCLNTEAVGLSFSVVSVGLSGTLRLLLLEAFKMISFQVAKCWLGKNIFCFLVVQRANIKILSQVCFGGLYDCR